MLTGSSLDLLYGSRGKVRRLISKIKELPTHPSALLVHKVSENVCVIGENLDRDERCVLTSSGNFQIEPNGEARINLGVALKAPVGTMVTLSPAPSDKRELWELISHKIEIDESGETIARIRNYSNTTVLIADKTQIASIQVSRIREIKSSRKKADKIRKLEKRGNCLPENVVDDSMMIQWMTEIQNKLGEKDIHKVVDEARVELFDLQKKWLANDFNPRAISIHDPDPDKAGQYNVIRIDGVRVKMKGNQKETFTKTAFMDPTSRTMKWNFIMPKEVIDKQNERTARIEKTNKPKLEESKKDKGDREENDVEVEITGNLEANTEIPVSRGTQSLTVSAEKINGSNKGYAVQSIEKAMLKLCYFDLKEGIHEVSQKEVPSVIREITERQIKEAGFDPSDYEWLALLGRAYSEAYAQWFDHLGPETMKMLSKDCRRYIVTDQRQGGDLIERQITSAFNLIGVSIHRAIQLTEFAAKKVTSKDQKGTIEASYEWIPRSRIDESEKDKRSSEGERLKRIGLTWKKLPTHDDGKQQDESLSIKTCSERIVEKRRSDKLKNMPDNEAYIQHRPWSHLSSVGTWLSLLSTTIDDE